MRVRTRSGRHRLRCLALCRPFRFRRTRGRVSSSSEAPRIDFAQHRVARALADVARHRIARQPHDRVRHPQHRQEIDAARAGRAQYVFKRLAAHEPVDPRVERRLRIARAIGRQSTVIAAEIMQRVHLPRLHGSRTNVELRCQPLHVVPFDEPQHDDVALLTVQPADRLAEHVAVQSVAGIRSRAAQLQAGRRIGDVEET